MVFGTSECTIGAIDVHQKVQAAQTASNPLSLMSFEWNTTDEEKVNHETLQANPTPFNFASVMITECNVTSSFEDGKSRRKIKAERAEGRKAARQQREKATSSKAASSKQQACGRGQKPQGSNWLCCTVPF